ncbi:class I SAM-dependent methyltransferase [Paraflavitalea speifideaquila]|uniref:class I SAM-dependent methyltransferase n=1 Tax=Paraflavitalea speifideaquila TaxID=3076558 RepID=UPI0028F0A28A|nr:class I SAM-dependent methyltransferase [Paraflavitalea speifideiaquila]
MKDLFSQQAAAYARYRPVYPLGLYDHLAGLITQRGMAWDCATGNGQAAIELARYFDMVFASDISEKQLVHAPPHDHITYFIAPANASGLPDHSIDLITVAQAYHWFDFTAFRQEVKRVAKPGALLAIWGYGLIQTGDAVLQTIIHDFYRLKTGPYWDAERKYVDDQYTTVPFPYAELPPCLLY